MQKSRLIILLLLAGCAEKNAKNSKTPQAPKPRTDEQVQVASVPVTPYTFINPFMCTMEPKTLSCVLTVDIIIGRGQREIALAKGTTFSYKNPIGNGVGAIWFGCAGTNDCDGYFMFSSSTVSVTPVEPARFWNKGTDTVVSGSVGILEVNVAEDNFNSIVNRWVTQWRNPLFVAGQGIVINCTDDTCTISTK